MIYEWAPMRGRARGQTVKVNFDQFEVAIEVVDTHAAGEPCRVAIGGFPEPEGNTMMEKRCWMENSCDELRCALMHEPRGHRDMFGAFLCAPVNPKAHIGVIFMDTGGYLNMCGHGTMATVTVALEMNLIAMHEGENEVALDTPSGLIYAMARVENGKVVTVSFENVPSFLHCENVEVEIEGQQILLDVAFGGSFFALIDTSKLYLKEMNSENIASYAHLGSLVRAAVNQKVKVKHPYLAIDTIDLVEFYDCTPMQGSEVMHHLVVFGDEQVDRSPCGTGLSAHLAALYHRGIVSCGEPLHCESFIGTRFTGEVVRQENVAGFNAVVPQITGRAFITGAGVCLVDAADTLGYGFQLLH